MYSARNYITSNQELVLEGKNMLGTAEFYKSTLKVMPKSSKIKRVPSPAASPVSKKRMTAATKKAVSGKSTNRSIKVGKDVQPRRSSRVKVEKVEKEVQLQTYSSRVKSLRSSNAKREDDEMKEVEEEEKPVLLGNSDSDDDDEDSDDEDVIGEMSEYETKRLQNIQENARFLASLGIPKTTDTLSGLASRKGQDGTWGLKREKRVNKPVPLPPRRPLSLRIRRINPEGVPLPDIPAPVVYDDESQVPERKPSGPLDMIPTNIDDDGEKNLSSHLCKSVASLSRSPKLPEAAHHPQDLAALTNTLHKMTLISEHAAKVTKGRVLSMAIHPSPSKILVCAGDKLGRVGVWDVDSQGGDDGVYLFEPHSRPVSCLQFAPSNPTKLYSCSYDGTVRCADFERGIFDEIHATDIDDDIVCSHFDFLSPDGVKLLVGQNNQQGHVQVVDSRLRCHTSRAGFLLHKRYVKTVHIHPTKPEYFVTASNDGTVALWDLRTLKEHGRCTSISTVIHGRSVSSAYFSPITGNRIVTTSYDDRIRILKVEESGNLDIQRTIHHDNHTGRWLTTFRTVWHPRREDVIVVGSMVRPRRIHVFDIQGHLLHSLRDDDYLGSVCSINAWHPNRDIVVGGNSSGKLHIFM